MAPLFPVDDRDEAGTLSPLAGVTLEEHLDRLARVREVVLREIAPMSLEAFTRVHARERYDVSGVWVLHHLLQHEAEHRSELGWLRRHA